MIVLVICTLLAPFPLSQISELLSSFQSYLKFLTDSYNLSALKRFYGVYCKCIYNDVKNNKGINEGRNEKIANL